MGDDRSNQTARLSRLTAACHCGRPGVVAVDAAAYCLDHLDDAFLAIERIRNDAVVAAYLDGRR